MTKRSDPKSDSTSGVYAEQDLRPEQVAALLSVHKRSVWRWLNTKKLPGRKVGRAWIVSREQLDKFIEDQIDAHMTGALRNLLKR